MKLKTGLIIIFLVIGLLGVPNCIFAQEYKDTSSDIIMESNLPNFMNLNPLNPEIKGGGGRGGSSSSGSASKTVKKLDGDDDDASSDDGGSWWIILIVIVIIGIIAILVWYFFLRK